MPVVGFPDYAVSDQGRVMRTRPNLKGRFSGKILSPRMTQKGYRMVSLFTGGVGHQLKISRLVLTAFVGSPPDDYVCNHKNGNKADDRLENLEWTTYKENTRHAREVLGKTMGGRYNAKLTADQVQAIRDAWASGGISQSELARMYGISSSNVSRIVTGDEWKEV